MNLIPADEVILHFSIKPSPSVSAHIIHSWCRIWKKREDCYINIPLIHL